MSQNASPEPGVYNHVARRRDLLKASTELALAQLQRVRRYVKLGEGDRFEAERAIDKAIHDLTEGTE